MWATIEAVLAVELSANETITFLSSIASAGLFALDEATLNDET
jgi:hypothetical protein